MTTLDEARREFARRRSRALADFLIEGARLRGGEAAAMLAAIRLAPLLSDTPEGSAEQPTAAVRESRR